VTREDQLRWEARRAIPAAFAAFAGGLVLLVSGMVFVAEDRKGVSYDADLLLSIDKTPGRYVAAAALAALGTLCVGAAFYYLLNAARARGARLPRWFIYLVIGAPVVYAITSVIGAIQAMDLADEFVDDGIIRGKRGEDHARELGGASPALIGLATAGTIGVAFLWVMVPVHARRVGLVTPFLGILGPIGGVLAVLPRFSNIALTIQAFWLGAAGLLYLGRWPGGRGPAWESGEAAPWPTAAQRRAHAPAPAELDPSTPPEPEPVPQRPRSRKRKKR
jgi:hypothetical protein